MFIGSVREILSMNQNREVVFFYPCDHTLEWIEYEWDLPMDIFKRKGARI